MLRALLDLVVPERCAGCGAAAGCLCRRCRGELGRVAGRTPRSLSPSSPMCWSAGEYTGAVRRAVIAYKERGRTALARPLARALAEAIDVAVAAAAPGVRIVVVPVPSSRAARRRRGHDHVGRLAVLAVRRLRERGHDAVVAAVLEQRHAVADQAGLTVAERARNVSAAFRVIPSRAARLRAGGTAARGSIVVLVDDVVTTGATLAEGVRALREAGVEAGAAVTVAATPRRARHAHVAENTVIT